MSAEKREWWSHCPCCGAFRTWCVCYGGQTYDTATGKTTPVACSPQAHGRAGYGFDDAAAPEGMES